MVVNLMILRAVLHSIFLAFTLGTIFSCCTIPNNPIHDRESSGRVGLRNELRQICDSIPPPTEFTKTNTSEMLKPQLGSYSYHFEGEVSCETVKEHFSNILVPQKWVLKEDTITSVITGRMNTELRFYRDKYQIAITCEDRNSRSPIKQYSFSCVWNSDGF